MSRIVNTKRIKGLAIYHDISAESTDKTKCGIELTEHNSGLVFCDYPPTCKKCLKIVLGVKELKTVHNQSNIKSWTTVRVRIEKKLLQAVKDFIKSDKNELKWSYSEILQYYLTEGIRLELHEFYE